MTCHSSYPEYKDSGVEWLGEIPSHWSSAALKRRVDTKITDGPHETPEFVDAGVLFVSAEAVQNGRINFDSKRGCITPELHAQYTEKLHPQRDDIFMVKSGATTGKLAIVDVDFEFSVWSPLALIRADCTKFLPRFLFLALHAGYVQRQVQCTWSEGTQPNISMAAIERLQIVAPPLPEQHAIAAYLDDHTARLDAAITETRRLIELLRERRAALISHAVTKGLDPDAPRKDSGIEWLGEIPAHWEIGRAKSFTEILRGKFTHRPRNDPQLYDGDYPFIQTGDISSTDKYISDYKQTLNEKGYAVSKEFPSGTLVMSIAANIGDLAILTFAACFPDSIVGLVPKLDVDLNYLFYNFTAQKAEMLRTATQNTQMNLNIERISEMITCLPPLPEQRAIAATLDREIARLDAAVAEAETLIARLEEYRAALIAAAVTGRINVC